jgi:hypothetical protein
MENSEVPVSNKQLWLGMGTATVAWALHLVIVYGFQSIACHWGFLQFNILGINALRLVLLAFTILAGVIVFAGGLTSYRNFQRLRESGVPEAGEPEGRYLFMTQVGFFLSALFLLSIVFSIFPILLLDQCAPYWW